MFFPSDKGVPSFSFLRTHNVLSGALRLPVHKSLFCLTFSLTHPGFIFFSIAAKRLLGDRSPSPLRFSEKFPFFSMFL